jgi:acetyl esterase/lipase
MTYFLAGIAALVLVFWVLGLWIRRGEDLRAHDHPIDPEAKELFTRPGGPSAEHREAEAGMLALAPQLKGKSKSELLRFTREFMEEIPRGRQFDCAFVPVDADGVPAEWVLAPGADPTRRVLYIHGGAFIAGSPNSHRTVTSRFSEIANAAVLAIDYRLMPENPRSSCIEDCKTAYRWIMANGPEGPGIASRLYISGDSAGGNLSLVLSQWIRDENLSKPDAVVALSPLTDSTYSGPSIRRNMESDKMLGPMFGALLKIPKSVLAWIFLLENRMRPSNPLVSPVHGNLANLPPTLVQVSEAEMLLDDARRYVNKARSFGSPARLQVWPGLLHVWQIFHPEVPEAREAFDRIGEFLRAVESGTN